MSTARKLLSAKPVYVVILTTGDGDSGSIHGIFSSEKRANDRVRDIEESAKKSPVTAFLHAKVVRWELDG